MRTLFLALMILLLPLRGWVGDVMAVELAAPAAAATLHHDCPAMRGMPASATGMDGVMATHTGMHTDGHKGAPADGNKAPAKTDCSSCSLCDICHSVVLTPLLPQLHARPLPSAPPTAHQRRYTSAECAPGFKPPIA